MRKLTSVLLILLVAGAGQAIRRHWFEGERNRAAIKRIFDKRERPGADVRPRRDADTPASGARARWNAIERRRR